MGWEALKDDLVERDLCSLAGMVTLFIDGVAPVHVEPIWEVPQLDGAGAPVVDQYGAPVYARTRRYAGGGGSTLFSAARCESI